MSDFTSINSISLGTTFGAWYAKTNEMITRLNALKVGGITGGDGILVRPQTSTQGGYTLDIASTISKNVTFNGNVTINGVLSSSYGVDVSGINVVLPANSGVTVGNIVYLDSTGRLEKALANDECTSEVVGVVIGFTGGNAQVATTGKVSGSSVVANFLGTAGATLQKGVVYFLSGGVSGAGTTLEPDVTSYVSKPMLLGLTGDTGLILPYRGYIGLTAASSSSSTNATATSGVLSINGITAALWDTGTTPQDKNLRTTGHVHGLMYITVNTSTGNGRLTKKLDLKLNTPNKLETSIANKNNSGILYPLTSNETSTTSSSGSTTIKVDYISNFTNDGFLFSTSGITADVYKLTNIKIIPEKDFSPSYFTFSLNKQYSTYAGTTITSTYFNDSNISVQDNSNLRIEIRRNGYSINGVYLIAGSSSTYTSQTNTASDLITPIIQPLRYTPQSNQIFTYGLTAGTISIPDSNGSYPIVYTPAGTAGGNPATKPSSFNINNITLGGVGSDASKYIQASCENKFMDQMTGASGYTLESAILGWNAAYGAICENLYFTPVSYLYNNSGVMPTQQFNCNILLEMYKFDTNTRTTTGSPIIVSSKYTFIPNSYSISGWPSTQFG